MVRVGLGGGRGMVGSVLMERMREEGDFALGEPAFFTTSNVGGKAPAEANGAALLDAKDVSHLKQMDVVITCQGGDYRTEIYPLLRAAGGRGFWLAAAKTLRMKAAAVNIPDPVNLPFSTAALSSGLKD